jgi:hypothetical protein
MQLTLVDAEFWFGLSHAALISSSGLAEWLVVLLITATAPQDRRNPVEGGRLTSRWTISPRQPQPQAIDL